MNDFDRQKVFEQKIGNVVEDMKSIEYFLDCIILNRIMPSSSGSWGFTQNIILNSSIIPIGTKLKIVKTICKEQNNLFNFDKLHRLINIRNLFAHESSYVEEWNMLVKMDELKSDGEYIESEFEGLYQEFLETYNQEYQKLTKLLSDFEKCPK